MNIARIRRELVRTGLERYVAVILHNVETCVADGTMLVDEFDGATFISVIKSGGRLTVLLFPEAFDRKMITAMKQYLTRHAGAAFDCCTHDARMVRVLARLGFTLTTHTDEGYLMIKER